MSLVVSFFILNIFLESVTILGRNKEANCSALLNNLNVQISSKP